MSRISYCTDGTEQHIASPEMAPEPPSSVVAMSPRRTTAHSSAVRRVSVPTLQCSGTSPVSKRPKTVSEVPTSIASNMLEALIHVRSAVFARNHPPVGRLSTGRPGYPAPGPHGRAHQPAHTGHRPG